MAAGQVFASTGEFENERNSDRVEGVEKTLRLGRAHEPKVVSIQCDAFTIFRCCSRFFWQLVSIIGATRERVFAFWQIVNA